jgi:hypothetical protein
MNTLRVVTFEAVQQAVLAILSMFQFSMNTQRLVNFATVVGYDRKLFYKTGHC